MCGIFAVTMSSPKAGEVVLSGLKKLEYRGYDSWGVAVQQENSLEVIKDVGKISQVEVVLPPAHQAIGHTRWATHGGVTPQNAHPHLVGEVAVVHNGIFENFATYKKRYLAKGYTFKSDTDTEVIACLLNDFYKQHKDPLKAIQQTVRCIEGRFAFVVLFAGRPEIYAARRGSPLIIGRGKEENFIASDIPAFADKTQVVNYLDDYQLVVLTEKEARFYDLETLAPIQKRDIEVPWKQAQSDKGDFEHFMLKEIFDQKQTIAQAINHEDAALFAAVNLLKSSNGTYAIACGTAHKVCMAGEYFFAQISRRKINVVPASEMPAFEGFIQPKTAMLAVSQSGETADVLEVLERAKQRGSKILSLTNVESSSVARISDIHLPINAGVERAVASTKAATAQMALLLLLAYTDAGKLNEGRELLRASASNINDMLNPRYCEHIKSIAEKIVDQKNLFIIGRNALYPMALEAAIKIQEVSYIHAQGFAAGELKHGPIALIEKGTPCLVLGDDLETISNTIEIKSRGAYIIGVSPKNCEAFDDWIRVPDCAEAQAIASIIPVQILAYQLATLKSLDPDMPRNLAKSVTVK